MTHVRIKGFKIFRDRHGKPRCYHRATGTAVDLSKNPIGSAGFIAECSRITALADKTSIAKPGTLGLLIARYRAHPSFTDLAARTRADYQRCFDYLKPIADTPLGRFNPPLVVRIRDKAAEKHGRRFGNYVRTVLALLFAWGKERGYTPTNPAAAIKGIRRPKGIPDANRPWSDSEREAVEATLPIHMRLPVALMMYCGLDPQDALKLPRTAISGGKIDARRGKTGEPLWIPLPSPAADALANAPNHDAITLCANSYGRPWTVSGFRASWRPIRKKLEKEALVRPGLTLKGLRHTVATILAEMSYDERTIADMLAQKTIEMARHYSRRADKSRKLAAVIENFDAEVNRRRTKIVKPT
jgi:integrase